MTSQVKMVKNALSAAPPPGTPSPGSLQRSPRPLARLMEEIEEGRGKGEGEYETGWKEKRRERGSGKGVKEGREWKGKRREERREGGKSRGVWL